MRRETPPAVPYFGPRVQKSPPLYQRAPAPPLACREKPPAVPARPTPCRETLPAVPGRPMPCRETPTAVPYFGPRAEKSPPLYRRVPAPSTSCREKPPAVPFSPRGCRNIPPSVPHANLPCSRPWYSGQLFSACGPRRWYVGRLFSACERRGRRALVQRAAFLDVRLKKAVQSAAFLGRPPVLRHSGQTRRVACYTRSTDATPNRNRKGVACVLGVLLASLRRSLRRCSGPRAA